MFATPLAGAPSLGAFLRERRARLQPGGASARRRTPGLRREEVATRAGVSVTWYTWLEQGRGGPPSSATLERLAGALELDAAAREALFLLAQHRPPPLSACVPADVSPAVQRVLDAMPTSPALIKSPTWEVLAWNRAAAAVLADYGAMPAGERNVLRRLFSDPAHRDSLPDWEDNARFALAVFRLDVARVGDCAQAAAFADELQHTSADFRRLWAENDVRSHGVGLKRIRHPTAGLIAMQYAAFAVDGAPAQQMVVFTPATPGDVCLVEDLVR